jgi:hypothetical protein
MSCLNDLPKNRSITMLNECFFIILHSLNSFQIISRVSIIYWKCYHARKLRLTTLNSRFDTKHKKWIICHASLVWTHPFIQHVLQLQIQGPQVHLKYHCTSKCFNCYKSKFQSKYYNYKSKFQILVWNPNNNPTNKKYYDVKMKKI